MKQVTKYYSSIGFALLIALLVLLPPITPAIILSVLLWLIFSKADERLPFGTSVIMIIVGAVALYLGRTQLANQFGNYAFYLFIVGFIYSVFLNTSKR
jgi:ABC-type spermidine/putrescine transport system permease subunit II